MSFSSQVRMTEIPVFMTQGYIINAIYKYGYRPTNAAVTKDKKGDKATCIIQFANEGIAKEVVEKLTGKPINISASGSSTTQFKLTQCSNITNEAFDLLVSDLGPEIDDCRLFKFFSERFKSLSNAKVIVDNRGKSQGFGFLKFTNEEDQKFCVKIMNGSLDLGSRAIKVGFVPDGPLPPPSFVDSYGLRIMRGDPWCRYTSWNQFVDAPEYPFVAVKLKLFQSEPNSGDGRELVKYNDSSNMDHLNIESLERDCHLWDALECAKWLPGMALCVPRTEDPVAETKAKPPIAPKKEENKRSLENGEMSKSHSSSSETRRDRDRDREYSKDSKYYKKSPISSKSSSKPVKRSDKCPVKTQAEYELTKPFPGGQHAAKYNVTQRSRVVRSAADMKSSTFANRVSTSEDGLSTNSLMCKLENEITESLTQLFSADPPAKPALRSKSPPHQMVKSVVAPSVANRASTSAGRLSTNSLMCKLDNEITESLTQLFSSDPPAKPALRSKSPPHKRVKSVVATTKKANVNCFKCGDLGHFSDECRRPAGEKLCYGCHKFGHHTAENCPEQRQKRAVDVEVNAGEVKTKVRCLNCDEFGHQLAGCPRNEPKLGMCTNCGKVGRHRAENCTMPPGGVSRGRIVGSSSFPEPSNAVLKRKATDTTFKDRPPAKKDFQPASPANLRVKQKVAVPPRVPDMCKFCGKGGHASTVCRYKANFCRLCNKPGHVLAVCVLRK